ncbi:methyl-accepting chemotaxis protein [Ideonella sp. DXS29W]|uniref:Methyl-accepting chemotaxis protein n=1 Tax=Ideonella lacteola TaxID=2984193 RepID=A0ABU9BWQ7_9BURK
MAFWKNWRVSTRLSITFALVGMTCMAVLGVSYVQQRQSDAAMTALAEVERAKLADVYELVAFAKDTTPRIVALNTSKDPVLHQAFGPQIKPKVDRINAQREKIRAWVATDEERAWFKEFDGIGLRILAALEEMGKARAAGDDAAAQRAFESSFMPNVQQYDDMLIKLVKIENDRFHAVVDESKSRAWSYWMSGALAAAVLLSMVGLLVLALLRSISAGMNEANRVAAEVAKGNLMVRADVTGEDELSQLNRSLSAMATSLQEVVQKVRGSTDSIVTASQQIASGNQDLSSRTEQQASHLQQTASTMEELSATVNQTAESASQANQLSSLARDIAERSGHAVEQVVTTMGEIEQSSRRIEEIIGVIDGISFQTNILALNAAVEAARAGEQGRGFAVVAGEVRQLAQRSAGAAKEIKQLIADSSEKVRAGSTQVQAAGQTMSELQSSVQQVTTLISEISAAAAEQRGGISGVSHAVVELDRSTQQNSALVEQAAAAAASMRDQAAQLSQAVAVFRVESH